MSFLRSPTLFWGEIKCPLIFQVYNIVSIRYLNILQVFIITFLILCLILACYIQIFLSIEMPDNVLFPYF